MPIRLTSQSISFTVICFTDFLNKYCLFPSKSVDSFSKKYLKNIGKVFSSPKISIIPLPASLRGNSSSSKHEKRNREKISAGIISSAKMEFLRREEGNLFAFAKYCLKYSLNSPKLQKGERIIKEINLRHEERTKFIGSFNFPTINS